MKHRITYLCFAYLAAACSGGPSEVDQQAAANLTVEQLFALPNQPGNRQCALVKTGDLDIPVDTTSLNYSTYPVYHEQDGKAYLGMENANQHSIDFYDLAKKQLVKRVKLAKAGPNGVSSTRYFFIVSFDSILVVPKNFDRIYVVDSTGRVKSKTKILLAEDDDLRFSLLSPLALQDSFLLSARAKRRPFFESVGVNTVVGVNIYTGHLKEFGPPLPKAYAGQLASVSGSIISMAMAGGMVHTRYALLSAVYRFDPKTGQTQVFPLKSTAQAQTNTLTGYTDKTKMMREVNDRLVFELPTYQNILYDSGHKLFYSVFVHAIPMKNEQTGQLNDFEDKPISIIMADEQFRYLGETRLPNQTHFRNFLVTKYGLLVSNAHFKNPQNRENVMSFSIFQPECN
jgi:hypothetical protein